MQSHAWTPGTLAGQEAIDSELEVANSEQLKLDRKALWQRVRLVLAHGPKDHYERPRSGSHGDLIPFPVVLVLGYENSPDHFEEGQPDFDGLLSRFTVHKRAGFVAAEQPEPKPAATSDTDDDSDDTMPADAAAKPIHAEEPGAPSVPPTPVPSASAP